MVLLLFARLGDLFSSKAALKGLVIFDNDDDKKKGIYTETFELWCRKLDGLTVDDFKKGMEGLESKAEESYRLGDEMWPPSYAEFRALAFPKSDRDSQAYKIAPSVFDPKNTKAIEDSNGKSKRYQDGLRQCEMIKAMLNPPPQEPKPLTKEEIEDLEKLERLKNGK